MRRIGESDRPVVGSQDEKNDGDLSAAAEAPGVSRSANIPEQKRRAIAQFPLQILVPEETQDALRQRSAETGASIRHIILRSLAADGFPVPKLSRWRD